MFDPITMGTVIIALLILFYPSYYFAKKKNFSIFWNLLWTAFLGPLWWIVLIVRKKKEYQVFKYKKKAIID